jgi:hypothetical protein
MKFAFLIHYLSDETRSLMQLDGASSDNTFRAKNRDLQSFLQFLRETTGSDHWGQWTRSLTASFLKCLERQVKKKPPQCQKRRLAAGNTLEAQSHGFGTGCLRFAVIIADPHARLASGRWPGSAGWDWLPTRLQ